MVGKGSEKGCRLGSARARLGSAQLSFDRLGSFRASFGWPALAWLSLARLGPAQLISACFG